MSSWYDWVPGVSNVAGAVRGDWAQAVGGWDTALLRKANDYFFNDPANAAKAGYDQAGAASNAGTQKIVDFYMGQQAKAQANYKPLQDMFSSAYGTKGLQAPKLPGGR